MGTKAISFRFKDDDGREARYESFVARLRENVTIWEETTSFALIETEMSASSLEWDLWINTEFDSGKDRMLVINVTGASASYRGPLLSPNILKRLLPTVNVNVRA